MESKQAWIALGLTLLLSSAGSPLAGSWVRAIDLEASLVTGSLSVTRGGEILVRDRSRVLRLSDEGQVLMDRDYRGCDTGDRVAPTDDGGFLLACGTSAVKVDSAGRPEWSWHPVLDATGPNRIGVHVSVGVGLDGAMVVGYVESYDLGLSGVSDWTEAVAVSLNEDGTTNWVTRFGQAGVPDESDRYDYIGRIQGIPGGVAVGASAGGRGETVLLGPDGMRIGGRPGSGFSVTEDGRVVSRRGLDISWPGGRDLTVDYFRSWTDVESRPGELTLMRSGRIAQVRTDGSVAWVREYPSVDWNDRLAVLPDGAVVVIGRDGWPDARTIVALLDVDGLVGEDCLVSAVAEVEVERDPVIEHEIVASSAESVELFEGLIPTFGECSDCTTICEDCRPGPDEPSALDRDPAVEPFRLNRRVSGHIAMTWQPLAGADYEVHQGTLEALRNDAPDHEPLVCGLSAANAELSLPEGDSYVLVAAPCPASTSFGRGSTGLQRPETFASCP